MRIGFFLSQPFHESVFRSTLAAIGNDESCLVSSDLKELIHFRPHVVVLAGDHALNRLRAQLPRTIFVSVRPGLTRAVAVERSYRSSDYVCLTSDCVRAEYERREVRPKREYWVIGYPQMDRLTTVARPEQLPAHRRVILYVPTWREGLSSLSLLGDNALSLLGADRLDAFVVIKLHPMFVQGGAHSTWVEKLRRACSGKANTCLIEDPKADLLPWLKHADVLISDASTVQLEYLAFNRPMILLNHPDRFGSKWFDPSGYEWLWRDMGESLNYVEDLPAAIEVVLDEPSSRSAQRERYRQRLFGEALDGRAGERLAARLLTLQPSVASESVLFAANSAGRVVSSCLPYFDGLAHAFRRATA